jgi:hypothetical protein
MPIHSCVSNLEIGVCNGYKLHSHDNAGLICFRNIYVDGSAGGNVDHRRTKAGVTDYVGSIGVDSLFWEKHRRP